MQAWSNARHVAKQKTQQSDDFLIGGYIPGRNGVDELVVGEKRGRETYFVASVKNGFVPGTGQRIYQAIEGREINQCPFVNLPEKRGAHRMDRAKMATVRWLKSKLVWEVAFNERTSQGHLRHSKFLRLRDSADAQAKPT
ncbi:MAG TPA: hypothetical protein VGI60_04920 [Chthoniobacterales bacterium]|jgi:bifunctional non-homologous end joining protein LigD